MKQITKHTNRLLYILFFIVFAFDSFLYAAMDNVLFKQKILFELYRYQMLFALVVIIFLLIVITALLVNIKKRRYAENALKINEARYRSIFENAVEGIFQSSLDSRYIDVNPAFAKMCGYNSPQDLIGSVKSIENEQYVNPLDYITFKTICEKYGYIEKFETQFYRKNRSNFWVSMNALAVYDEKGDVLYYEGTVEDITIKKSANDELKKQKDRLAYILEGTDAGTWEWNIQTGEIIINDKCASIIGYKLDEVSPVSTETWMKYTHPDDVDLFKETLQKHYSGEHDYFEISYRMKHRQGHWVWVLDRGKVVLRNDNGEPIWMYGTHQDTTERINAEHALLSSQHKLHEESNKLRTITDNSPFGIALIDKDDIFGYVNPKFKEMFGYDLNDIPNGKTWFKKAYPDPEYRHNVIATWIADLEEFKEKRHTGERKTWTFTVTCKDNSKKIISFIPVMLPTGEHILTCEDITEKKHLESQLRQAQKTEAIGTLAGGIAHDFNNILTALMGYATLLQIKMGRSDPLQSYVDQILSASQKAADLTKSFLTFSRKQPLKLAPLDINNAINETKRLLNRLLIEDIELNTSLTEDSTIVMADKSHIDQILFNLATNARDAMPNGGTLTIKTHLVSLDDTFTNMHGFGKPGRYVLIDVSDTGIGMDDTTLEKIFDPFFTTKEVGKGTGLGLATVYGIVKQHNGYIDVKSSPYKGTTFHIYLPAADIAIDEKKQTDKSLIIGHETVLIAEDDLEVRRFISEVLKQSGYKVIEAIDGQDAIDKVRQNTGIDLAIIDSVMPKKNGREAYEQISRIKPNIKVLFMSGHTKDTVLSKGIEEKRFNFIAKPLVFSDLLTKIREVLEGPVFF